MKKSFFLLSFVFSFVIGVTSLSFAEPVVEPTKEGGFSLMFEDRDVSRTYVFSNRGTPLEISEAGEILYEESDFPVFRWKRDDALRELGVDSGGIYRPENLRHVSDNNTIETSGEVRFHVNGILMELYFSNRRVKTDEVTPGIDRTPIWRPEGGGTTLAVNGRVYTLESF